MFTATYSPEDNKLRLYASERLPKELYDRVRAAGFIWAPKQDLFVAPAWSPARADLLEELAGEIGDEDKTLVERAEERAERFEDYSESRAADADRAHAGVHAIADNIPLGQPILVGHHSERRARKDAERIENGMRKAVKMWETSKYWTQRAAGALSHAKYKMLPAVRARRIKTIEADKRRQERANAESVAKAKMWEAVHDLETARKVSNFANPGVCPNNHGSHWNAWDVLRPDGERYATCPSGWTWERVRDAALRAYGASLPRRDRWIEHYDNRLAYERAMLGESGGLAADRFNIELGGQVLSRGEWVTVMRINRKAGAVCSVRTNARYCQCINVEDITDYRAPSADAAAAAKSAMKLPPICNYPGDGFRHQTQAEYDATVPKWSDFSKVRTINATETVGAHRVRCNRPNSAAGGLNPAWRSVPVFITDAKRKDPPAAATAHKPTVPAPMRDINSIPVRRDPPELNKFNALKGALSAGVQVVSAPQLFPTPPALADRVADLADIRPGHKVLEPSAGTGNLIRAIRNAQPAVDSVMAVEISQALADRLRSNDCAYVICGDFLALNGELGQFDRIVMNPPFAGGADIKHIQHARTKLKPCGRLVAICANGPRQREALMEDAAEWIDLEPGSFLDSGTNVNAAIVVFDREPAAPTEQQPTLF